MKTKSLLILSVCSALTAIGQSPRLELMEEFTQASCPPCAVYNPAFNDLLNNNPTKVVALKYQTDWPGTDPMNVHNPAQVQTRVTYYSVTGVPSARLDGGAGFSGSPASVTQTTINNRYNTLSPFTIDVDYTVNGTHDSIFCHARIKCTQAYTGGTMVAHTAVMERDIYFATAPGSNGEKHFEGVMKKMLPSDAGLSIASTWAVDDSMDLNYSWKLANVYDVNQLAVVCWVQNNTNKQVLQAGYMRPNITSDVGILTVTGVPAIQCLTSATPVTKIRNYSINTMTSCDITYQIDAGTVQTYNWTGSLAPDASATVTLPTVTLTSGPHTINLASINPNGQTDMVAANNLGNIKTVVYDQAIQTPISADFVTSTFPPSGFAVENVTNDAYTWLRSSAGHGNNGSAKMPFYNAASGTTDNLYVPKFDFSNAITGSYLTFDHAYAQYYTTDNDRLQIRISTNCGINWTPLWDKAGLALKTRDSLAGVYTAAAADWVTDTISLDPYIGQANVLIQFHAISNYGNNLYVDNINVQNGTTGIPVILVKEGIELFPNPAHGTVNLAVNLSKADNLHVTMMNSVGAEVFSHDYRQVNNENIPIDISGFAKGSYVVSVHSGSTSFVKHLVITE